MRLINANKLMELYENTPECNIDDGHVSIPVIRQNILDMPTINHYEWISVEDRLPTHQKEVLCYYGFDRGDGDLGMMFMGTLCYFCFDENPHWQHSSHNLVVTHWMELPEPPTEKEN